MRNQEGIREEPGSSQEMARATKEERKNQGGTEPEAGEPGMSHLGPVLGLSWASWACQGTLLGRLGLVWARLGSSGACLGPS